MKIKELTDGWRGDFRALVASITTKLKRMVMSTTM